MENQIAALMSKFTVPGDHAASDYFTLLRELLDLRRRSKPESSQRAAAQAAIDQTYALLHQEILGNQSPPLNPVKFGTSGWRGILGKDINVQSVRQVTQAIINVYRQAEREPELAAALGGLSLDQARRQGVVLGHDNRFGGPTLARAAADLLSSQGFVVHFAGESTTGVLSAAVLVLKAACSINLTPSHNPLEYGGFKYNAADAGPAAAIITNRITREAVRIIDQGEIPGGEADPALIRPLDALACWQQLVRENRERHGLDYDEIMAELARRDDYALAIDCVYGASRVHLDRLLAGIPAQRLLRFRDQTDPTFDGVAPEPSSANLEMVNSALRQRPERFKLGAIIDPDGDRIRFTDGTLEFDMNLFGAMAYHYLHQDKGKRGMVAKTVATSNFANAIAKGLNEEVFEPPVGFKEFKPVIGKALVIFEESDGISLIGHTPEKDAYIGLLLALDLLLRRPEGMAAYLAAIRARFGRFFPGRGGVTVSRMGQELEQALAGLERYRAGVRLSVGGQTRTIKEVITVDGRKMIFDDDSWLMIRPSGTEPKVRFYVEARSEEGKEQLLATANGLLEEIGLL
ncbi:MAG TPA: phosphoglucomutase [Desulfurivibrio alkaliphilus]|uniref:Phosphoglucomutase n=1 Tax=Desulfurivibrio alkaliphilus TaxID=427923 RepID=A0A7C2TGW6_9BACT|nr:phosphoglucomutase [Desulfurivibrio alkaliphilus]